MLSSLLCRLLHLLLLATVVLAAKDFYKELGGASPGSARRVPSLSLSWPPGRTLIVAFPTARQWTGRRMMRRSRRLTARSPRPTTQTRTRTRPHSRSLPTPRPVRRRLGSPDGASAVIRRRSRAHLLLPSALSRSSAYEVLMDSEVRPILKQAPTMVFRRLILKRRPARCRPPHRNARSTTTTARTDSNSVRTTAGTTRATSSRVSSAVEVRRLRSRARDLARR
jgi:hypothetical protein